jgi:hypothetical protein
MPISTNRESNFMAEFVQTLAAVVAFLLPVGGYCLYLAWVNRRPRPLMAGGSWDSLGLLFAASGFFVVTVPVLLTEFYRRTAGVTDSVRAVWVSFWILWLIYFFALLAGSFVMIQSRSRKTMIYNVDTEIFPKALEQACAQVGLETQGEKNRLVLHAMNPNTGDGSTASTQAVPVATPVDSRHAQLEVETFPSMCHVTLHWRQCDPSVRDDIERELDKALESAAPLDNPAAGWFLSVSGLILGAVSAIFLAIVFLFFFLGRFV